MTFTLFTTSSSEGSILEKWTEILCFRVCVTNSLVFLYSKQLLEQSIMLCWKLDHLRNAWQRLQTEANRWHRPLHTIQIAYDGVVVSSEPIKYSVASLGKYSNILAVAELSNGGYNSWNCASCSSYPCNAISCESSKSWLDYGNTACCPA